MEAEGGEAGVAPVRGRALDRPRFFRPSQGHDLKRMRHTVHPPHPPHPRTELTPRRGAELAQPKRRLFLVLCCLESNQARNSGVS